MKNSPEPWPWDLSFSALSVGSILIGQGIDHWQETKRNLHPDLSHGRFCGIYSETSEGPKKMKLILLLSFALLAFQSAVVWFLRTSDETLSFALAQGVMWLNLGMLTLFWGRLLVEKKDCPRFDPHCN